MNDILPHNYKLKKKDLTYAYLYPSRNEWLITTNTKGGDWVANLKSETNV